MRVLVCGSRDWDWPLTIKHRLARLARDGSDVELMHGAARGADQFAAMYGRALGFNVREFPADWSVKPDTPPSRIRRRRDGTPYDLAAGNFRNLAMLDEEPDVVIAFQRNGSRGTQHTVDEARRRGIPVEVITA